MSINANELRLGNWMIYTMENGKWQYIECNLYHLADLVDNKEIGGCHPKESYSPVPITEQVLIDCGFSKGKYGEQEQWLSKENERHNPYTKFSIGLINSPIYGFLFQIDITTVALQSLHKLQNLYFVLTGTELTYTPPNNVKEI